MSLTAITLNIEPESPTPAEATWIAAVQARAVRFQAQHPEVRTLLASDPQAFCAGLRALRRSGRVGGSKFCDWGCGLGTLVGLAALQGFQSYGIEREPSFVAEAQALLRRFSLSARIVAGSFIPKDLGDRFRVVGTYGATDWQPPEEDAYQALGTACEEMDLIYAYPWPREVDLYAQLFDTLARPGAVLWLYRQGAAPLFYRKTA